MEERVPDYVAARNLQQPLAVMISSARKKGYEPICFNQNLYVIRREHSDRNGRTCSRLCCSQESPATVGGYDLKRTQKGIRTYLLQSESIRDSTRAFRSEWKNVFPIMLQPGISSNRWRL